MASAQCFKRQMGALEAADAEKTLAFQDSKVPSDCHSSPEAASHCYSTAPCRPLVVPEASDVEIHIPFDSRANARVSFDGRNTCRMARGSIVK